MVIVFIGPPGSGKGTQAQILKDSVLPNLHILTVSSLLKEKSSDGSVLGNEIKNKMDNGDLIEDSTVISVLKEKVDSLGDEQILVDGFPRSSLQAESLKKIFLNKNLNIINFTVSDEELLTRIKKRSQENQELMIRYLISDYQFIKNLTIRLLSLCLMITRLLILTLMIKLTLFLIKLLKNLA